MWITRQIARAFLLAPLLAACGPDAAPTGPGAPPTFRVEGAGHNSADHFRIDLPADFELESPCNGELITLSGQETGQLTLVDTREHLDAGFALHSEHQGRVSATGAGSVTGAAYAIRDVFHESFDSPSPPAPQFTASFHETFHVTSSVSGLSFTYRRLFHLVKSPSSDEFKVTQDVEEVSCHG